MPEFGLDQSFSALSATYGNPQAPIAVDQSSHAGLGLGEALLTFGEAARRGVHIPMLEQRILELSGDSDETLSAELGTELIWFLFSQKAWDRIRANFARVRLAPGTFSPQVADLYVLAHYRLELPRILEGEDRQGFFAAAAAFLDELCRAFPTLGDRHRLYRAMFDHVAGHFDEARGVFSRIDETEPLIGPLAACESVLPPNFERLPHRPPAVARWVDSDLVTLISIDASYFHRFGRVFAEAYSETNSTAGLHLHCVGFDPAAEIAAWDLPIGIGWTVDDRPLAPLGEAQKRGYFASARYIHLDDYLSRYERVFVTDADGLVIRSLREVVDEHPDDDVVLSTKVLGADRQLERLPWEAITANAVLVRSTEGGRNFARQAAGYLEAALDRAMRGASYWYADQNALFYAWLDKRSEFRASRFNRGVFAQGLNWRMFESDSRKLEVMTSHPSRRR